MPEFKTEVEAADAMHAAYKKLTQEVGKVIVGQEQVIRLVLTSIFCQGHSLLVGVPGLAKTRLIQTIAATLHLSFNRVQFTPDLMPSDILGSETLDQERKFHFSKGAIFANIILADEINRTPPKTQAALLEAMQERQVTVAGQLYRLPEPFFVLATQNPIEQEGTYPLPEAQLDRFMFNILVDYPDFDQEIAIVKGTTSEAVPTLHQIMTAEEILYYQQLVRKVPVPDNVIEYAVKLVQRTRPGRNGAHTLSDEYLEWGAGPRASQYLVLGAKCNALLEGKYSPDIEDVQAVAAPILRHRIVRNYKADAEGYTIDSLIEQLL